MSGVAELAHLYDAARHRALAAVAAGKAAFERYTPPPPPEALSQRPGDPLRRAFGATTRDGRRWCSEAERIEIVRG